MANPENLKKNTERTPSERSALASKAGKASVQKRRKKKQLKEVLELLLSTNVVTEDGERVSFIEAVNIALLKQALKGNVKAYECVRDTIGQTIKPGSVDGVEEKAPIITIIKGLDEKKI